MSNFIAVVIAPLSVLLSLSVGIVCAYRREFLRYLILNLYLLGGVAFSVGGMYVSATYGFWSPQYYYFYYTGDALGNILGYLLIGTFFDRLLRGSAFHRYVRPTLAMAFLLVVGITGLYVFQQVGHLYSHFAAEFQQNLYFLGVLLTFLLWMASMYLRAQSRRFNVLVSGLGIYFSAIAANYALQFLAPGMSGLMTRLPPLAYLAMVSLWLYSFWRIPEDVPATEPVRAGLRGAPVHVQVFR